MFVFAKSYSLKNEKSDRKLAFPTHFDFSICGFLKKDYGYENIIKQDAFL